MKNTRVTFSLLISICGNCFMIRIIGHGTPIPYVAEISEKVLNISSQGFFQHKSNDQSAKADSLFPVWLVRTYLCVCLSVSIQKSAAALPSYILHERNLRFGLSRLYYNRYKERIKFKQDLIYAVSGGFVLRRHRFFVIA